MKKFSTILEENLKLQKKLQTKIDINIISNINLNFIDEVIKNHVMKSHLLPNLKFNTIDEINENASLVKNDGISLVFWETFNILPTSINKIEKFENRKIQKLINKLINEIDFLLNRLEKNKAIFFNLFNNSYLKRKKKIFSKTNIIVKTLNKYLLSIKKNRKNLHLIQTSNIYFKNNYNLKAYNKTKSIYNFSFLQNYSKIVSPKIVSLYGKIKKVLILDCDNTLWHGLVGEKKINFSKYHKIGKHYFDAQKKFKHLSKNGALICLCSKNNNKDVNKILLSNKPELLKNSDIIIKKVNWNNKADNILQISKELNLSLNSFIFLDDSDFEINLIKKLLPEVLCYKVPANINNYNDTIFEIENYFKNFNSQFNIKNKTNQYKGLFKRINYRKKFKNIDEYIKSLNIKIYSHRNSKILIPRISQMSLKTNQFNLTTKRYTEKKIEYMIKNKNYDIFAFSVKDIFGDNGVTAIVIIKKFDKIIIIDSFLMSCRIIGRKIENTILKFIINKYKFTHDYVLSKYVKTEKNSQVENFFSKNFFSISKKEKKIISYKASLKMKNFKNLKTISNIYEKAV